MSCKFTGVAEAVQRPCVCAVFLAVMSEQHAKIIFWKKILGNLVFKRFGTKI